jgi:hypothetical protein
VAAVRTVDLPNINPKICKEENLCPVQLQYIKVSKKYISGLRTKIAVNFAY